MANLKVSIVNPTTLRLEEDGKKGDTIDLKNVQSVDTTAILDAIKKSTDEVYNTKLRDEINRYEANKKVEITELKREYEQQLSKLKSDILNEKTTELNKLQREIDRLLSEARIVHAEYNSKIENLELKIKQDYQEKINQDQMQIQKLMQQIELLEANKQTLINEKDSKHSLEIASIELAHKDLIQEKENELNQLRLQRSSLQIKPMGENLEKWCNSEYEAHAIAGFSNSVWRKDTIPKKAAPDEKGTKADYIFEVYSGDNIQESELLLSVTCEIKGEAPDTKVKQKNSDHFKKLDEDRIKNNSQYALLISELEWDTVNDVPIKKVQEYENMYIVRPTYFISFLALIKSLADKYKELLKESNKDGITFKESQAILDEFEQFKVTYLENPIRYLTNDLEVIKKEAQDIYESSYKIVSLADKIISNRIEEIKVKIERFNIRRIANKVKKLDD